MGKTHWILIICTLLVLVSDCAAVQPYQPVHPDPLLEPWRWRSFPELKGVKILCMAEDRSGKIWFGTVGGVRCYNGFNWKVYEPEDGLNGTVVTDLCGMRDGSVYAGTEVGISRFQDGMWQQVFPPAGDFPWDVQAFEEGRDGSLWVGTNWGLLRLQGRIWTLYTTAEVEAALREAVPYVRFVRLPVSVPAGKLRAYRGIGVLTRQSDRQVLTLIRGSPGDVAGLKIGDRILETVPEAATAGASRDSAGVWRRLKVQRGGFAEPVEIRVRPGPVRGQFLGFGVSDVHEDRQGTLWLALDEGETIRAAGLSGEGEPVWRVFTQADGLDPGSEPGITQSRDGVIWLVSDGRDSGVNRFDGQTWSHLRLSEQGGTDINPSVHESADGTVWVGGRDGYLHAYREGKWRGIHSVNPVMPKEIYP